MGGLAAILIGVAAKVGATMVKTVLEGKLGSSIGGAAGDLAGTVIDTIASKAGVTPAELPDLPQKDLEKAVTETEAMTPELIALWQAGLQGQFALLMAEQSEAWYQSAWRWGWMYLLAVFWTFYLLVFPMIEAFAGIDVRRVDLAVLLTLTTWFISLYMGGHTVKALGESAINAVRAWKDERPAAAGQRRAA